MKSLAPKLLGRRLIARAVSPKGRWAQRLDPAPGFRMMFDMEIPARWKILSYLIGFAITAVLEIFEAPLNLVVLVLPGGAFLDLMVDGAEALVLPIWIACIVLPMLHKREVR